MIVQVLIMCVDKIAELRELHVNQLSKHIEKLKADRCGRQCQPLFCRFSKEECDALQLGHLILIMSKLDLEREGFRYQNAQSIYNTVCTTKELCFVKCSCKVASGSHSECSWVPDLKEYVQGVWDNVRGLNFADFPSRRVARVVVY